jgi:competence ComEA-like helix-hairpin-helix protein
MRARGSILVGLLWCLALLGLVVIGVLHTARMELIVARNHDDRLQAHYLALAGIEKAKALLYQDAGERRRSSRNHSGELEDAPQHFRDVPLGRGLFRVLRGGHAEEGEAVVFGVEDEASRLNLNTASAEELGKLQLLTADVAAAIVDWRDADNAVSPGGAEAEYYASLRPPSQPRNGPFQTVRELLMVRGVSRELFLGDDAHQNGGLEAAVDAADEPAGAAQPRFATRTGWGSLLTVDSTVQNVNAAGQDRVNLQSAGEASLTSIRGVSAEIARAIVAHRGRGRFSSVADLLEVAAAPDPNAAGPQPPLPTGPPGTGPSQLAPNPPGPQPSGPRVISQELLLDIADDLTTDASQDCQGLVNINTAGVEVLVCLPGVDRELARAIVSYRQSSGFFPNIAWLLKVPGMSADAFKQLAPRVTARSETYRILSEGLVPSSGARSRIQVIVHVRQASVRTLSYREDDL